MAMGSAHFLYVPSRLSTVTPGQLPTCAVLPVRLLNNVVLPQLGLPAKANLFILLGYLHQHANGFRLTQGKFVSAQRHFNWVAERCALTHVNFRTGRNTHIEQTAFDFAFAGNRLNNARFTDLKSVKCLFHTVFLLILFSLYRYRSVISAKSIDLTKAFFTNALSLFLPHFLSQVP